MKIIEKIKKRRVKAFLLSFVVFLIIFVILDCAVLVVSRMRESAIRVFQLVVVKALKDHIPTPGEPVPTRFSPVAISEKEYYLEDKNTYYYPDAWDKPGRILLKRRCGGFYYLILGDGTMATVTYWSYQGDNPNVKPDYIQPTGASKYMFGNFWFICVSALIIAVTISLIKKEEKAKTSDMR